MIKNKIFLLLPIFIFALMFISSAPQFSTTNIDFDNGYVLVTSEIYYIQQNEPHQFNFFVYNKTDGTLQDNATITCNFYLANKSGEILYFSEVHYFADGHWGIDILGGNFSILGTYAYGLKCEDGFGGSMTGTFYVTPTGEAVDDFGNLSTGILYFLMLTSFAFLFLGYLFLKNDTIWIKYTGLFFMIIGFAFLYYDLHLSNLYASTIAINSGASNVTSGIFVMFARFIKLAPYIVAGVIAFFSVNLFRATIKKKNSSDGWDNGNY